jgi:uncharacterized membrane protein YraQ (UPF0718 family)
MDPTYEQMLLIFASIIYEALPFVVLGVIIAGILEEFVPQQIVARIFEGRLLRAGPARLAAIAIGGVLGLIFPMCECGIIPIMQRLLRKGVPVSVCVCYMLAGPIINVVVITATFVAFNPKDPKDYLFPIRTVVTEEQPDGTVKQVQRITGGPWAVAGLRVGLGFLVAFGASVVVEYQYRKYGNRLFTPALLGNSAGNGEDEVQPRGREVIWRRFGNVAETALHDFVDIMAFLVLGACLAAVVRGVLHPTGRETIIQESPALAILLLMGLAIAICLCSEADAFVAAAFPAAWPPAAKIAFMVLGPMLDFKLYLMYLRVFRQRLIWTIIVAVVVQVFVYTLLLHYLWEGHGYSEAFLTKGR